HRRRLLHRPGLPHHPRIPLDRRSFPALRFPPEEVRAASARGAIVETAEGGAAAFACLAVIPPYAQTADVAAVSAALAPAPAFIARLIGLVDVSHALLLLYGHWTVAIADGTVGPGFVAAGAEAGFIAFTGFVASRAPRASDGDAVSSVLSYLEVSGGCQFA
ncbi:MAG: hypothetical protein Q9210_006383, partial [Variospora velana]